MHWIYLSPHFDDAVLSCGGMISAQRRSGDQVEIWTVCAGEPLETPQTIYVEGLHQRWQTGQQAVATRRAEDIAACQKLDVGYVHLPIPDCIYRWLPDGQPLIQSDEELFQPVHPAEAGLVAELAEMLAQKLPDGARIVSPLTVGQHRDHYMTRQAAEMLGRPLWHYPDFPYVLSGMDQLRCLTESMQMTYRIVVDEDGLTAWQEALREYTSQISTFWPDLDAMRQVIRSYAATDCGTGLWQEAAAG